MKVPPHKKLPQRKTAQAGFVISLEFLLVVALVVLPLMVGLILLGRKAITLYLNQLAMVEQPLSRPVLWDGGSPAKPIGPVIGYDRFETPLVLYRDKSTGIKVGADDFIPGVLLGVRPRRFTTTSKVYYDDVNCTGSAYVKSPSATIGPWPNVGYVSQTQGINYAVGNGNVLYWGNGGGAGTPIVSIWTSQDTGDGSPASTPSSACVTPVPVFLLSVDTTGTAPYATVRTTTVPWFSPGDVVVIAGTVNYNGVFIVQTVEGNSFTIKVPVPAGLEIVVPPAGSATPTNVIPDLVAATTAADLDGPGNFTLTPLSFFKLAFPTQVPGAPLVPTGG